MFFILIVSPVVAGNTAFVMDRQRGEELGFAKAHWYYTEADAAFHVERTHTNGVVVSIPVGAPYSNGVRLQFESADHSPLTTRLYDRAVSLYRRDSQPQFDVSTDGVDRDAVGFFIIKEIFYGAGNAILKFHASFSWQDRGSDVPVEGEIYFNATATPPPRHHITSERQAFATRGQPFRYQITGSGEETTYTASGLPAGLTVSSDGIISGTPETEGNFQVVIQATGAEGTASATLDLKVDVPSRSTGSFRGFFVRGASGEAIGGGGAVYRSQDEVVTHASSYSFNATVSFMDVLRQSHEHFYFSFSAPNGQILKVGSYDKAERHATDTKPGLFVSGNWEACEERGSFVIHELASDAVGLLRLHASFVTHCDDLSAPALVGEVWYHSNRAITSRLSAAGRLGEPFRYQIVANVPGSFSASGLPPGLTVNTATGVISGTPSQSGLFNVTVGANGSTGNALSTLALHILPPSLVNISTRMQVGRSDNVLIGGFIVSGALKKKLMIRALGPSLAGAGLSGVLPDPKITLYESDGSIEAVNDDWKITRVDDYGYGEINADQRQEIEQSGIAPSDDLEAAMIVSLDPGAYTAIVEDVTSKDGIGLIEVYDLGLDTPEYLANISTRGYVRGGDSVLIGGIIIAGGTGATSKIVVRAIGPSLAKDTVLDPLSDPQLTLHNQNGTVIAANDNWETGQQAELRALQLAPADRLESALVHVLTPGGYTAIVRGSADDATGIALVEVYEIR